MTTKVRKKTKTAAEQLTDQDRYNIVLEYMKNEGTAEQIAQKFNTTAKNVDLIITRHWRELTNVREAKTLIASQTHRHNHKSSAYHALKQIGRVPSINTAFLQLLSDAEDSLLTDPELQYCYHYIATGDSELALKESGLDIAILKNAKEDKREKYRLAAKIRGHYLRRKPNVAAYITKLKEEQYIPEIIDKQFVQRELLETLHQQKEAGVPSKDRLRTIELLGKSVGAFSEVIKVEEVDPSKALDYLDSLAQVDASESTELIELLEEEN